MQKLDSVPGRQTNTSKQRDFLNSQKTMTAIVIVFFVVITLGKETIFPKVEKGRKAKGR